MARRGTNRARDAGSLSAKTRAIAEHAMADGITPLEVMLHAMRAKFGEGDLVAAAALAKDAAPYVHPRLGSIAWTFADQRGGRRRNVPPPSRQWRRWAIHAVGCRRWAVSGQRRLFAQVEGARYAISVARRSPLNCDLEKNVANASCFPRASPLLSAEGG